jgi:uncharacterized damage-inducible protein DinB
MIAKDELERLLEYNIWANHRMLRVAVLLNVEDFQRELGASHRSVRGTLVHVLSTEQTWFDRWRGATSPPIDEKELGTAIALRPRWVAMEEERRAWLRALPASAAAEPVRYTLPTGEAHEVPFWKLVQHMVNHSTYHRGQLVSLYRQLGARPLSTDMLTWDLNRDGPWGGSTALGPR